MEPQRETAVPFCTQPAGRLPPGSGARQMLDSRRMPHGAASRGGRTGLLLINLGTPNSPRPEDVRPSLDEFLSDPRVLDIAAWAQCFATARGLAALLRVPVEKQIVCFQSRLGRTPWIRPYTDEVVVRLARDGIKRAVILCPAFVADCLETIEELGMRAVKSFRENGGEVLTLVPAVNASDAWADAVVTLSREASRWIPGCFAPAAPPRHA